MESDEDEDVIFVGSQLYAHLTTSEYSGPEINFYSSGKINLASEHGVSGVTTGKSWKERFWSLGSKVGFHIENHEEEFFQKMIHAIMNTSLISLEDVDFLSNMFDDMLPEVARKNSQNGSFAIVAIGGVALSATLLSVSRIPWTLRAPSLLYIAGNVLRAFNKKINESKRKRNNQAVDKFQFALTMLHDLCLTMTKSVQFVQEMELIDRGFTLPNLITHLSMKTLPNQPSALLCLPLRQELLQTVRELHEIMRVSTLRIRETLPLNSAVDNASHYLACCESIPEVIDQQHVTLQTLRASMRQCHLQLSEMLRRLALSFLIPTGQRHFRLIDELSRDLPARVAPLTHRLRMAYDYYTAWKVSDTSEFLCSPDVVSNGQNNDERPKGLDLALHSLERHLRATALIIDSLRGTADLLPGMRIQLSHECKAVATCWELVEMEMLKLSNPSSSSCLTAPPRPVQPNRPVETGEILPLYGAWEPDVQDLEILEADLRFSDVNDGQNATDDDDDLLLLKRETREERLARKRELAAQSKRLYSELQVVLQSKAAEWKEREARVMERLGRTTETEEEPLDVPEQQEECIPPLYKEEEEEDNDRLQGSDEANQPNGLAIGRCSINSSASDASIRFDTSRIVPCSTFGVQASLAAQVRALASQRGALQNEDLIGDSDSSQEVEEDGSATTLPFEDS